MTDKTWILRPYQDGDQDQIRALFEHAFDSPLTVEHWAWQYRRNPLGQALATVAVDGSVGIVGHYALRPVRMKMGDEVRLCALAVDAMVHADYRKQGMFVQLASRMHQAAGERGVPLVYAFPQETSSHAFYTRLNWVRLYRGVPLFAKVLNAENVLGSRIDNKLLLSVGVPLGKAAVGFGNIFRGKLPADCRLEKVSRFDDRMDDLWDKASAPYSILAVRDKVYLNWRFIDNPVESYTCFVAVRSREERIAGYMVLKCEERFGLRFGFIIDMLSVCGEADVGDGLIAEAVTYFRKQRMDIVGCLMLEHAAYAKSLWRNGFIRVPASFFPQVLTLGVYRSTDEWPEQFITNTKNWFITFGDHDAI